ncbi:MAG: transcriptional regulator, GntR family [Pseudonocardia sp.]|jgi:DNA-binding GntR family transcriptional regulator|nr:transcriptional regulator, GntR family [Pseudonocardia sp.]
MRPGARAGESLTSIQPQDVVSVSDLVTDALRTAILSNKYPAGTRLRQEEVANALGVSRQPVREAMKEMVREGLLIAEGAKGHFVREFTAESLAENYRLRRILESEAAFRAAHRITKEQLAQLAELNAALAAYSSGSKQLRANYDFHKVIRVAAESPTLERIIDSIWAVATVATPVTIPGRAHRSRDEHDAIIAALEARDADAARDSIIVHIENAATDYFDEQDIRP